MQNKTQTCKHEEKLKEFFKEVIYNHAELLYSEYARYLDYLDVVSFVKDFELEWEEQWEDFLSADREWPYLLDLEDIYLTEDERKEIKDDELKASIIKERIQEECPNFYSIGANVAYEVYKHAITEIAKELCPRVFETEKCSEEQIDKLVDVLWDWNIEGYYEWAKEQLGYDEVPYWQENGWEIVWKIKDLAEEELIKDLREEVL